MPTVPAFPSDHNSRRNRMVNKLVLEQFPPHIKGLVELYSETYLQIISDKCVKYLDILNKSNNSRSPSVDTTGSSVTIDCSLLVHIP